MSAICEAKVKRYLSERLRCEFNDIPAIMFNLRRAAQVAGYPFGQEFARAGLGAGPAGRIASEIVDRALLGGAGSASTERQQKLVIDRWVRTTGAKTTKS